MRRYLRLYACFLRFSFSKALQFRMDFFFRVLMDAIFYAVNLGFFVVLYEHTALLGGWDRSQAFVFIAAVFLADAIHMTVFSNNTWWFPIYVNRGDLDYYLLRPVSSLFFLSVRDFAANSFLNLLLAVGILVWALARYPHDVHVLTLAAYAGLLLVGAFIHYAVQMIFLIPVFWLHGTSGLREVFFALDRYSGRPHGVYTPFFRRMLVSVLPLALIVSVPSQAFFDGMPLAPVLHVLVAGVLSFLALVWFWRRGLGAYASASS